jgi:hypothetical protein
MEGVRAAFAQVLAIALLLAGCSRGEAAGRAPRGAAPAPAAGDGGAPVGSASAPGSALAALTSDAVAAARAAPGHRPAWTAATSLAHPPVPLAPGVTGIVAHTPGGFDPSAPLHLVLFFHGSDQCVAQLALGGDVVCKPGGPPDVGAGIAWRHDDAGTMSIFAAPQFVLWGGGTPGRMAEPGYFRAFVEELLASTFAPGMGGPKTLDDLADVTIVAHSAGHLPLAALLDRGGLDEKVVNVILLDTLYDGDTDPYARWVERGVAHGWPRKLVAIYGAWGRNAEAGHHLAARLGPHVPGGAVVDPPGSIVDAIRAHGVTMKAWPHLEHAWMLLLTMSKTLEGLGFPPRAVAPPRLPYGAVPAPTPLVLGEPRDGTLDDGDAVLQEGSLYDDFAVDLDAGQRAVLEARGHHSFTEGCCSLDVVLDVLRDGTALAHDDDSGGYFDARLAFTAPERGRYVVRVSTYGAGRRRGPYTLIAR